MSRAEEFHLRQSGQGQFFAVVAADVVDYSVHAIIVFIYVAGILEPYDMDFFLLIFSVYILDKLGKQELQQFPGVLFKPYGRAVFCIELICPGKHEAQVFDVHAV